MTILLNIVIENNDGSITFHDWVDITTKYKDVFLEQAYLYCSNAIQPDEPVYIDVNIADSHVQTNIPQDFTFIFPAENAASNVLKVNHTVFLGQCHKRKLTSMRYRIYDHTFTPLTGTVKLVLKIRLDNLDRSVLSRK
jgi:hypothetical protein